MHAFALSILTTTQLTALHSIITHKMLRRKTPFSSSPPNNRYRHRGDRDLGCRCLHGDREPACAPWGHPPALTAGGCGRNRQLQHLFRAVPGVAVRSAAQHWSLCECVWSRGRGKALFGHQPSIGISVGETAPHPFRPVVLPAPKPAVPCPDGPTCPVLLPSRSVPFRGTSCLPMPAVPCPALASASTPVPPVTLLVPLQGIPCLAQLPLPSRL